MKISIIVPTYNEKDNIEKLITSISAVLEKFDYEIVFVYGNRSKSGKL